MTEVIEEISEENVGRVISIFLSPWPSIIGVNKGDSIDVDGLDVEILLDGAVRPTETGGRSVVARLSNDATGADKEIREDGLGVDSKTN